MKRFCTLLLLLVLVTNLIAAAKGTVSLDNTIQSKVLGHEVKYAVWTPDDYDPSRSYPVLYLLHGLGQTHTDWIEKGDAAKSADKLQLQMIIIMPDGARSWYVDDYLGKQKYETMFFTEFIPQIEKQYPTQGRAIAGLSMGGYGALLYSLKHPTMFSSCGALSSGIYTDEWLTKPQGGIPVMFTELFGKGILTDYYQQNSVFNLVKTMPEKTKGQVKYWIDCGDDDFLWLGNSTLHQTMRRHGVPHEYRVRDGGHTWDYWKSGLPAVLDYTVAHLPKQ